LRAKLSRSDTERLLSAASFADNTSDVHDTVRADCPVVKAYHLVDEVLNDPERFSSEGAETDYIDRLRGDSARATRRRREHFGGARLNGTEPPDRARIRRLSGRSFLPPTPESYASEIEHSAAAIIKCTSPRHDRMGVVGDFAEPLPVEVLIIPGSWCTRNELVRGFELDED
jgi:cytochrome P450